MFIYKHRTDINAYPTYRKFKSWKFLMFEKYEFNNFVYALSQIYLKTTKQ